jgi:CRISPR-associated protein Csx10
MTGRPPLLGTVATLGITTESDWHVGSGHGVPGSLNAVVRRDADNLPYVPGTTLTGVVRDACLTVARALDNGGEQPWQQWHRVMFGDAGDRLVERSERLVERSERRLAPAAVTFGPARLPEPLRHRIRDGLVDVTTSVRVSVAIDPCSGRAKDNALRFTEVAVGGLPLEAGVHLDLPEDDDARAAVSVLLALGCGWCTELGGDRRRGLGRVTLRLGDGSDAAQRWAAWLTAEDWNPPRPELDRAARAVRPADLPFTPDGPVSPDSADNPTWTVVELAIRTCGPVRVPRQTLGNVVRGHDFLPGSLLLPWLSDRLGASLVRAAITSGQLVARNALPEVTGRRGVPAPLALSRIRRAEDGKPALVFVDPGDDPPKGYRQVRGRWTAIEPVGDAVVLQQPALAQISHNAVDRSRQRPTSDAGIYELEVIPAGRTLHSRVLLSPTVTATLRDEHGEQWWQRLAGPARFGARRRGEYGAADVTAAPADPPPSHSPPSHSPPTSEVVLLAVTDLLVRGPGLGYSADPGDVATELRRRLGVRVGVEVVAARTSRRDSWHAGWQLPRDTMVGLAAGTVLRLTVDDGVPDAAAWNQLLLTGVGDRTAEGFGEIVAGGPLLTERGWDVQDADPATTPETVPVGELDSEHARVLAALTERANQRRVATAVISSRGADGYKTLHSAFGGLSRSQRGAWLALASTAAIAGSTARIREHATAWTHNRSARRANQRQVAERVLALLDEPGLVALLGESGLDLSTEPVRARALAVLVADIVDDLRRNPDGDHA